MRKIRITNRALKILDRLKDRLIAKRKRSDRRHFETDRTPQDPVLGGASQSAVATQGKDEPPLGNSSVTTS